MTRVSKIFFLIALIISSCATVGTEIKRDGRYILLSNGVVRDVKTRLEWLAGPDQDLNWFEAKTWIATTRSKYGGGWRMPSRNELSTLYVKGAGTRNMTPFIISTGWEMWTNETWHKTHAWLYSFLEGKIKVFDKDYPYFRRVLAVRTYYNLQFQDDRSSLASCEQLRYLF